MHCGWRMKKRNCWEFKKCGRELGGANIGEKGVCAAAIPSKFSGTNKGVHGGRFCWAIRDTICDISDQESFQSKLMTCLDCQFFKEVQDQEEENFTLIPLNVIKNKKLD